MLRLHRACLHQEGLPSLERHDRLPDQSTLLLLTRVAAFVQLDDLLEVRRLSVCRDTVLVRGGLDAIHDRAGHALRRATDCCAETLQVSGSCREVRDKLMRLYDLGCLDNINASFLGEKRIIVMRDSYLYLARRPCH